MQFFCGVQAQSILIENYKGILEYSGECLVVQAADCRVRICGKNLWIAYYNEMEMKVCGCIRNPLLLGRGFSATKSAAVSKGQCAGADHRAILRGRFLNSVPCAACA
ncbi:MAG: YabP/YqfC family sporulation protein [Lachnospiraceae bacterium]